jgi:hypothetical protein
MRTFKAFLQTRPKWQQITCVILLAILALGLLSSAILYPRLFGFIVFVSIISGITIFLAKILAEFAIWHDNRKP